MYDRIDDVLAAGPASPEDGVEIGRSREGRAVRAVRLGTGPRRVSLLGGCHADEPVGPRLLRHVAGYLAGLPPDDPLLRDYEWWLVPHINPDGEERNRSWFGDHDAAYDLPRYLAGRVRELPGDDIEFGFPVHEDDGEARPEPRAVYQWWRTDPRPFVLHVSLHGMGFAAGPWFLIDRSWKDRCDLLKDRCATEVAALGYTLHDVERQGEKGFVRLGRGFCTRPDSRYMREHFRALGDEGMASRFRPSSMETARSLGGDALTLVTEMPLFVTPGVGDELGPPDPVAVEWRDRIDGWRAQVHDADGAAAVAAAAAASGVRPMPVRDQMVLQWTLIAAGLEQVGREQ